MEPKIYQTTGYFTISIKKNIVEMDAKLAKEAITKFFTKHMKDSKIPYVLESSSFRTKEIKPKSKNME